MSNSTSKSKGNAFEIKTARELGSWIFGDKNILYKHSTSGAIKIVYNGDIVPQKNIPMSFNNGVFPFLIECKHGYKGTIPNLNNQTIVRKWISKSIEELNERQKILYLIIKFHNYSTLFITDVELNIKSELILNLKTSTNYIPFYIYNYNSVLSIKFNELYKNNQQMIDRLKKEHL